MHNDLVGRVFLVFIVLYVYLNARPIVFKPAKPGESAPPVWVQTEDRGNV